MKIIVTGNLGYIGPELGKSIKNFYQQSHLEGVDTGLFLQCTTCTGRVGDTYYDSQKFLDIRDITIEDLKNCETLLVSIRAPF